MSIGITEMIILLVVVLLIFGAGKLPKVAGDVAKGIKAFKGNLKDETTEVATTTSARDAAESHRA